MLKRDEFEMKLLKDYFTLKTAWQTMWQCKILFTVWPLVIIFSLIGRGVVDRLENDAEQE